MVKAVNTAVHGQHVIITGGSSGIGLATASVLHREGATVSLMARDGERLRRSIREAGIVASAFAVDVTDRAALRQAFHQARERHGACDVLVTCAGYAEPGYVQDIAEDVFAYTMDVDYFGTVWAVRAVLPEMVERGRGVIVGVSSVAGLLGVYGYTAYAPAKFAVRGFIDALRMEMKDKGVHVACVYPADVRTPQLDHENRTKPAETVALSGTIEPIEPERVARAILRGINRRSDEIFSDRASPFLARFSQVMPGFYRRLCHYRLARYRRRASATHRRVRCS
ncbi:3-dehydrosphinganine reductase [Paractinoplanes brasiliensis]|uniref:3-dehydrosphinganine reductase n=1 Tax=Paractinoplanes brasiliensis TaxID=52695 RepID=A0A4R6JQI6_9ACTN|nr:3-dehydrosphinganine reductase [Actinoplanes brasiliensis]GID33425.1 short-chain dehydrogenase/reductase SDR [Actinoplanes brasiliensis]